jgi:hypothetical protein
MGQTLAEKLSALPPTKESIESIKLTIFLIQQDIDESENEDRKRVQKLNVLTCKGRMKEIENSLK